MPEDYDLQWSQLKRLARKTTSELRNELSGAQIDYVRCWFQWNFFQPRISITSYKFPLDDFVFELKSAGIEIVAVIGNGYSRFLPFGINDNDPIEYLRELEKSARAIVKHYSNSIRIWQIENEPNWWFAHVTSGWRHGKIWKTPGFQDAVLQTLQTVVREESPSSTIVVNLEADRKRTRWKNYSKFCDAMGVDFYPNYMKPLPIDVSGFDLATEIKAQTELPLFIAETGYPSGPMYAGYSETNQDLYVTMASEKALSLDALNGISIWRYSDSAWKSSPVQENYFGLANEDGTPKPGLIRYKAVIAKYKDLDVQTHKVSQS